MFLIITIANDAAAKPQRGRTVSDIHLRSLSGHDWRGGGRERCSAAELSADIVQVMDLLLDGPSYAME